VVLAELADGPKVRTLIPDDRHEHEIPVAGQRNLPTEEHPHGIEVDRSACSPSAH